MPAVLDDSLSYYECLCKITAKLNETIASQNNLSDTQQELQKYVANYFTNLDVQEEINNKLDEMAEDGTLSALFEPFISADITDWLEKNVDPVGSAVIVDKSLTVSGAAADAKVVGDSILSNINDYDWLAFTGNQNGSVVTTYDPPKNKITTITGYAIAQILEKNRCIKCFNGESDKDIIFYFECSATVSNIILSNMYSFGSNATTITIPVSKKSAFVKIPKGTTIINPVEDIDLNYVFFQTSTDADITVMCELSDIFYEYSKLDIIKQNNNSRNSTTDAVDFSGIVSTTTENFNYAKREVDINFTGISGLSILNTQINCVNGALDKDFIIYIDTPNTISYVALANTTNLSVGTYVRYDVNTTGKQIIKIPKGTLATNPTNVPLNYLYIPGAISGTLSAYYSDKLISYFNYDKNGDFDWLPITGYRNNSGTYSTNNSLTNITANSITAFILNTSSAPSCINGKLNEDLYIFGYSSTPVYSVILSATYNYNINLATCISVPVNKSGYFTVKIPKDSDVLNPMNTKLTHVFFMTLTLPYSISAEFSKYNHIYNTIEQQINSVALPQYGLVCWGDSITAGDGGNGTTYPAVLAGLLDVTYFNGGGGGDTSYEIATRAGGNNIVLPIGEVNTYTTLTDIYGNPQTPLKTTISQSSTNPITINAAECTLVKTESGYSITGYDGSLLSPTLVKFSGTNIKGNITCILAGTNDSASSIETRMKYIDAIINNTNGKYIVLGISKGTKASQENEENTQLQKYGNKFFNTREMMSQYGMQIMNLPITDADETAIEEGSIPPSLLSDNVHFNANGYTALAKMLYSHIVALGY